MLRFLVLFLTTTLSITMTGQIIFVTPTGTGNGNTWETACQLQVALNRASSGTQIWVKKGIYKPTRQADRAKSFILKDGVQLLGGFNGSETSLSQRNSTTNITVLSGDIGNGNVAKNSYNIVTINSVGKNTIIDGFTIRDGVASEKFLEDKHSSGAGIYINAMGSTSFPTISNCVFENNTATYGAAIFLNGENGNCQPVIKDCYFQNNIGSLDGGAIYNMSKEGICHPVLINCYFANNEATYGGAIFNAPNNGECVVSLDNCLFSHNTGYFKGGAIFSDDKEIATEVEEKNCSYDKNYPDNRSKITYLSSALLSNGGFGTRH